MQNFIRTIIVLAYVAPLCMTLLFSAPVSAQQVQSPETLKIVTFRPLDDAAIRFAVRVQVEAYHRLGYDIEVVHVPGKRASAMAEAGDADGELARPGDYGTKHPGLIRVDEPCAKPPIMAYATDPDLQLDGWESLRGRALRVEYQRGMSSSAQKLKEIVEPLLLSEVNTTEQGLMRLLVGRVDVYIDAFHGTEEVMESEAFQTFLRLHENARQVRVAGVMGEILLYPWLHGRYGDLAPRLAEVLREMKSDGSFERYANEVWGSDEVPHW